MNLDLAVSKAFIESRLTRKEACELLGIDESTLRRILSGKTKKTAVYVQCFNMVAGIAPALKSRGKDFRHWRFKDGLLWTDENMAFSAGQIRAIWKVDQLVKEQARELRELKGVIESLRDEIKVLKPEPVKQTDNVIDFALYRSGGNAA